MIPTVKNLINGKVFQMEVGALLVGKISNHKIMKHQVIYAGQEKAFLNMVAQQLLF